MNTTAFFEAHRARLFGIAYRMLGSVVDAEDIVQDAFLRWQQAEAEVTNPAAYLTTIVSRLCLDHLKSARVQRETYVGPWLPEPLLTHEHPEQEAEQADAVSTAFLLLLEALSPVERAVFLLHDVFSYSYDEVADIVDKTPTNCRQLAARARQHLHAQRPRFDVPPDARHRLLDRFLGACNSGEVEGLRELLEADAVLYSDGGGKVVAALKPIYGADKVTRFLLGIMRKAPPDARLVRTTINDEPGLLVYVGGTLDAVWSFDLTDTQVRHIYVVRNPDKLRHVHG